MYIKFSQNKANYKKGQLAPFFIAILAVLIIAVFVTVNIGKISLIKTHTANAADAGTLTGSSIMAQTFNTQAVMNATMEVQYLTFWLSIFASFTFAYGQLSAAQSAAAESIALAEKAAGEVANCNTSCQAVATAQAAQDSASKSIAMLENFDKAVNAIFVAITGFWLSQLFFYLIMRDQAEKGRESAMEMAYRFAFNNSGITNKLIAVDEEEDENIPKRGNKYNYRDAFSDFVQGIDGDPPQLRYAWTDGQQRKHIVWVKAETEDVDTYDLMATIAPYPLEVAYLNDISNKSETAAGALKEAVNFYGQGIQAADEACGYVEAQCVAGCCVCCCAPPDCPNCCTGEWVQAHTRSADQLRAGVEVALPAIDTMKQIYLPLVLAWAGLAPGLEFTDSSGWGAAWAILCWVEDIDHDRKVQLTTWQAHEGAEYGLWGTEYAEEGWDGDSEPSTKERVESYSLSDFEGQGSIHPPENYHDSTLEEHGTR